MRYRKHLLARLARKMGQFTPFQKIAVAQATTTDLFVPYCEDWYFGMEQGERLESLPVIWEGKGGQEIKCLMASIKSALFHGEMSWALSAHAIQEERGFKPAENQCKSLVSWMVDYGVLQPQLTTGQKSADGKTKLPHHKISTAAIAVLLKHARVTEAKMPSPVFVPITADRAVKLNGSQKAVRPRADGKRSSYVGQARATSVAGADALAALNALAGVELKLSKHAQNILNASLVKDRQQLKDETVDAWGLRLERINKYAERMEFLIIELQGSVFYIAKIFDWRGRVNDDSGEFSAQALKWLRAALLFADGKPVDQQQIEIQLGMLYCKTYRVKGKYAQNAYKAFGTAFPKNAKGAPVGPDGTVVWAAMPLVTEAEFAICFIDACQQGFQLLAVAFGDKGIAKLTNLTGDEVNDFYSAIAELLGLAAIAEPLDLDPREMAKAIFMPYIYGAGAKALCRDVFDEGFGLVSVEQMRSWISVFEGTYPSAKILKGFLRNQFQTLGKLDDVSAAGTARLLAKACKVLSWELPDGFTVAFEKNDYVSLTISGDHKEADFRIKLPATERWDLNSMVLSLAPCLIHSLDGWMLREITRLMACDIVPIHDSYGVHSCEVERLRDAILATLQRMATEKVLNGLVQQLVLTPAHEGEWEDVAERKVPRIPCNSLEAASITNRNCFM